MAGDGRASKRAGNAHRPHAEPGSDWLTGGGRAFVAARVGEQQDEPGHTDGCAGNGGDGGDAGERASRIERVLLRCGADAAVTALVEVPFSFQRESPGNAAHRQQSTAETDAHVANRAPGRTRRGHLVDGL